MKYERLDDSRGFSLIEILMVVAIFGIVSAIAVPQMGKLFGFYKLSGDARSLSDTVSGAKMRAAADFSQARVYVDLSGKTFQLQTWDKTNLKWTTTGGTTALSSSVIFGFGSVGAPPSNTQPAIAQAATCTDDTGKTTPGTGNPIANTACVIFNSRGVPVDTNNAPTANDALYVTDGTAVYAVTVAATGMIRSWQTPPTSTP